MSSTPDPLPESAGHPPLRAASAPFEPDPLDPPSDNPTSPGENPADVPLAPGDPAHTLACPHCGAELICPAFDQPYETHCTSCAQTFTVPAAESDLPEHAREAERRALDYCNDLSGNRMKQITALRQSAIRSQTYCVCGAILCLIGMIKLILMTIRHVHERGWQSRPLFYIVCALLFALGTVWLTLRARHWNRESHISALDEPANPPDFSTLSDGSQRFKNLEDVR